MSIGTKGHTEQHFAFSLYNAALCLQKLREHSRALIYLKKALMGNPDSAEILNAIGFSYSYLMDQGGKEL
jgi:tetratricopeptide (TPR) repeat protein